MRGRSLICSLIEKRSNTNGELEARLADIATKSFLKRPSLKEAAAIAITNFMSNAVFVKNRPDDIYMCDAAILMSVKSQFRWIISGTSRAFYFADRKLVKQSEPKEYPRIGLNPSYTPVLEPIINYEKAENAFFLCSKSLIDAIGVEGVEKALQESSSQDDWMKKVEERAGDTDFAAQALIMPEQRKVPLPLIIGIAAAVIAVIILLVLILK